MRLAPPNPRYFFHNFCARQRQTGIAVELTFKEWFDWWEETGCWNQRGNLNHQYAMTRINPKESWNIDNIKCETMKNIRSTKRK